MINKHLFCFGLGYSAGFLANILVDKGWTISATTSSKLRYTNSTFNLFDFNKVPEGYLNSVSHILVSAPPISRGDPVLLQHSESLKTVPQLEWIAYLSSTGVYGNSNGKLVTEDTPPNPNNDRAYRRRQAEVSWSTMSKLNDLPLHLFRLAGIYGPNRSILEKLSVTDIQRIEKPGHKFSRIHVEDISNVLLKSIENPAPGEIYNVCDNNPSSQSEVIEFGSRLLGLPVPEVIAFNDAEKYMSPSTKWFWQDNRLVDNSKIRVELGVKLLYPSYKEGLREIYRIKNLQ